MPDVRTEIPPRFKPGDRVLVRQDSPKGHYRTPSYCKGKLGKIDTLYGNYRNPEILATGGDGLPRQGLYRVLFLQKALWGARYKGPAYDTLCVDIYDHWLTPA